MKKDNRLISSIERGARLKNKLNTHVEYFEKRDIYDVFLGTKLNLSMFIPCEFVDGKWVVLDKPEGFDVYHGWLLNSKYWEKGDITLFTQYQKAKDLVLFEGVTRADENSILFDTGLHIEIEGNDTIEDLTDGVRLTKQGLKQAGL